MTSPHHPVAKMPNAESKSFYWEFQEKDLTSHAQADRQCHTDFWTETLNTRGIQNGVFQSTKIVSVSPQERIRQEKELCIIKHVERIHNQSYRRYWSESFELERKMNMFIMLLKDKRNQVWRVAKWVRNRRTVNTTLTECQELIYSLQ